MLCRAISLALVVSASGLVGACGTTEDERPATLEYITSAVLAPSCGNAQCHSSLRRADGYAFGTVDDARDSLLGLVLVETPDTGNPAESFLIEVMTRRINRMPRDQPLPNAEVELIRAWIAGGAKGAQCPPSVGAAQCFDDRLLYECGDDYNLGALIEDCSLRPTSIDPVTMETSRWRCRITQCVEEFP